MTINVVFEICLMASKSARTRGSAHLKAVSKILVSDYVIFEICLMASKSARMRGSAHLKAVSKILVSKFLFQNCCSRNSCFKMSVSKFLIQNSCSKISVSNFVCQSFCFKICVPKMIVSKSLFRNVSFHLSEMAPSCRHWFVQRARGQN